MKPCLPVILATCLSVCLLLLSAGCSTTPAAPVHPHLARVEGSGAKLRLEKRPTAGSRFEWSGAVDGRGYATGPGTRTSYDKNGRKTQELDATFANGQPAEGPYELRQFSRERLARQTTGFYDASGKVLLSEKAAPGHDTPEAAYLAGQLAGALPLAGAPMLDPLELEPPPAAPGTPAGMAAAGALSPAPRTEPGAALPLEAVENAVIPRQRLARPGAEDARGKEEARGAARQQVTLESAVMNGIFFSSRSLALEELERHCLADIEARAEQSGHRLARIPGRKPRWTQAPQVVTRQVPVVNGKPREQYRATGGKLAAEYYLLQ